MMLTRNEQMIEEKFLPYILTFQAQGIELGRDFE